MHDLPLRRRRTPARAPDRPAGGGARLRLRAALAALVPLALLAATALQAAAQTAPQTAATGAATEPAHSAPGHVAIVDVTVVSPEREQPLEHQVVVVDGGRIAAVGDVGAVRVPDGALRIDGAGRWLVPGLAEMHGHLPGTQQGDAFARDVLFLYLANGVTTVRGMLGEPRQLALRDEIAAGRLAGPRLLVGSPPLHGGSATSPEQAARLVASYAEQGYDHLKVHEGLAPDVYAAIAAAAREHDVRFGGHVSDFVGLHAALAAGQATIDHLDNVVESLVPQDVLDAHPGGVPPLVVANEADAGRLPELAATVAASGVAVVPTLALWETFLGGRTGDELRAARPELRYMPAAMVDQWAAQVDQMAAGAGEAGRRIIALRSASLAALAEAGVPVLLGTDSPQLFSVPGFSMRHEVAAMTAAGMTPRAILRAGTLAVAAFYGETGAAGVVAPGARADLILLRDDPLADAQALFAIEGVVHAGRWLGRAQIDERLAAIAAAVAAG